MQVMDRNFLTQQAATEESGSDTNQQRSLGFDVDAYAAKHGFHITRRKDSNTSAGLQVFELSVCPFNDDHRNGSAAFTLSAEGRPGFSCKHNSCAGLSIRDIFARFPPDPRNNAGTDNGRGAQSRLASIESLPSVWSYYAEVLWVIEGVIADSSLVLVSGDSGVGKSTLIMDMCACVAQGKPFLGRATLKRPVLYVDRENPLAVVRERLDRHGIPELPNFKVWGGWVDPPPESPASAAIVAFAKEHKPLIVFDSLVAFHTGSEQDASETRKHMQLYRNLASAGASVVVLHHTGKSENARQYRGSSDIKAAVDTAWLLESPSGSGGAIRSLRLMPYKSRIAVLDPISIEYANGSFRETYERVETNREKIENIVRDNPGLSKTAITNKAQECGVAKNRAEEVLDQGEREGWLHVERGAHNRKSYSLAEVDVEI